MKSNIEYLKETIEKGEDATEWIDAIEDELKTKNEEIESLEDDLSKTEEEKDELNSKISELEDEIENGSGMNVIDFGYDKLYWKSGNLKIAGIMEELNKKYGISEMQEA